LKKAKIILLKGLFYLMALQILNLSIDIDYIAGNVSTSMAMGNYDDIDSITEYILEKVIGDNNYTSEDDDDEGDPQSKGFEKYDCGPLFFEPSKVPTVATTNYTTTWTTGLDQANKTCKGYFNIVSPPPKV
jgi:hypothetical protein